MPWKTDMPISLLGRGVGQGGKTLRSGQRDRRVVANLGVRVSPPHKSEFRGVLVPKPWGCEYLCGRNRSLEVWELRLDPASSTSSHCHPNKDTLNLVLDGSVVLETLGGRRRMSAGDFVGLKAGAIHRTVNDAPDISVRLLEIESPPDKYDLIRVKDAYGRESLGYEHVSVRMGAVRDFAMRSCLETTQRPGGELLRIFMPPRRRSGKRDEAIAVYELALNVSTPEEVRRAIPDLLTSTGVKAMIVTGGSIVSAGREKSTKLLPGDCLHGEDLRSLSWRNARVSALLW
jgi:mannose-6-phosphate isomerase-like protein (cupin superfamily)